MWKISFCSRPLFHASSTFGLASNHHQPLVHFVVQELGSPVARCQLLTNAAKASFPSQTVCVYGSQKNVQEWSKLLLHVALYLSLFLSLSLTGRVQKMDVIATVNMWLWMYVCISTWLPLQSIHASSIVVLSTPECVRASVNFWFWYCSATSQNNNYEILWNIIKFMQYYESWTWTWTWTWTWSAAATTTTTNSNSNSNDNDNDKQQATSTNQQATKNNEQPTPAPAPTKTNQHQHQHRVCGNHMMQGGRKSTYKLFARVVQPGDGKAWQGVNSWILQNSSWRIVPGRTRIGPEE